MITIQEKDFILLKLYAKKLLAEKRSSLDLSKDLEGLKDKEYAEAKKTIEQKVNVGVIVDTYGKKLKPKPRIENTVDKQAKAEEKKRELERLNRLIEESNKAIKSENREINQYYDKLRKSVEMVARGYLNSVFVEGRGGTGKTHQIISKLNELGLVPERDYVEFQGEMSSAFVYRFIYENNGKIIIFRDLINLITAMRSLELLKAMTDTKEPRVVKKGNYSKETEDLNNWFECKSRFIFEFNALRFNGLKEDVEALLSRGDYTNIVLSFMDIANIMKQIAQTEEEKGITEFLLGNYKYVGINTLNLRTQKKAFQIYNWAKERGLEWKDELKLFLNSEITAIRRTLYSLVGNSIMRSSELKRIMVLGNIDGVNTFRSADRRLREYVLMGELFIVGFVSYDEEELEEFMNTHKAYAVSINPTEKLNTTNATTLQATQIAQG